MSKLSDQFRKAFLSELRTIPADDVAVFSSGGIDSNVLLLGLLEIGKRPISYSFTLDDRESTDFRLARANADSLGIRFVPVLLPTDLGTLMRDTTWLVQQAGARKKTAVECGWPMLYAIRATNETHIATGVGADGNFGLSKKVMMHFAKTQTRFDQYRTTYYTDWYINNAGQSRTIATIARAHSHRVHNPYFAKPCWEPFIGSSWDALNKPKEKQPLRDAFPDVARLQIKKHTNLQLGDSGIAEHFGKLLDSSLNDRGSLSVVGIYNSLAGRS